MKQHLNGQQILDYLYLALTDTQRETMELHLTTCPVCRARLGEQEAIQRRMGNSVQAVRRQIEPPAQVNFAAIAPRLQRSKFSPLANQSRQILSGVASLAVLVALGVGLVVLLNSVDWVDI